MKKIILLVLLPIMLSAQITLTETRTNADVEFYFYGASLDSGITYSPYFDLSKYNGNSLTTYPLTYVYEADSLVGDGIFAIYLERKFENHDAEVIDTITAADTALTSNTDLDSGTLDLNNKKAPKYRLKVVTSSADAVLWRLKLTLFVAKED